MKAAAHATSPLTANVTIAPPRNIQINVGVRSTSTAASWKSSNAPAARAPAAVVRRTASGTSRQTVQAMPMLMPTPNTAVPNWEGIPSNNERNPATSAPTPAQMATGLT